MNIPDELLAAYVEGQLDGAARVRIEQAIKRDARLAQRVAQYRANRTRLHSALDGARHEPVSQRLPRAARSGTSIGSAQVIDLARVRAERARRGERHRTQIMRRIALAASVAGGLLLGMLIDHVAFNGGLTRYRDGVLLAHGPLADALNNQLAAAPVAGSAVRVDLSFKAKAGNYCRTFVVSDARSLTGLACRDGDQWQVLTLVSAEASAPTTQSIRTAVAGVSPLLLQAVDRRISGTPLDTQAEAKARGNGWR